MPKLNILTFSLDVSDFLKSSQCAVNTNSGYSTYSIKQCTTVDCTTVDCTTINCTTIKCTTVQCVNNQCSKCGANCYCDCSSNDRDA